MLITPSVTVREHPDRVRVHGALDFLSTTTHPEVRPSIHLPDRAGVQASGQGQRPSYRLDVTTEGEVVSRGQRVDEALEHDAHMIAGDERLDLRAMLILSRIERPLRMIGVDAEDVPRLRHLAVRQHAVLAHLLLGLLRLREEPSIEALRIPGRSGEVVDAGLGHTS